MPFFSRSEPAPVQQPIVHEQPKKHGLFSSHSRSPTRDTHHVTHTTTASHHHATSTTSPTRHSTDGKSHGGLLSKLTGNHNDVMDPSIVEARERVMRAEAAEREADRALIGARESVRLAREHVRRLELEAQEEARLAKIKQGHAKEIGKRGKALGRHGI